MDQLLQMIQSADPTDNQPDSPDLLHLEGKTYQLGGPHKSSHMVTDRHMVCLFVIH